MRRQFALATVLFALVLGLGTPAVVRAQPGVKLSPVKKVGRQTVRVAYTETDLEWLVTQRHFVIDGKRVALPPTKLGYDPVFSAPRWLSRAGKISGLKFWEFDKEKGRRRVVQLAYPGYRVISRGKWQDSPGGDTVPDPPK